MDTIDTTGKSLVEHWKWAAEKGLMKANTANALQTATAQIIGVLDNWESLDVRTLDVEDVFRRFQNKRNKDFTPASLSAYKRRFTRAVRLFLEYAASPSEWKAPSAERPPKKEKGNSDAANDVPGPVRPVAPQVISGLVEYPFPLREGRLAYLRLPADLKLAEVRRLTAYMSTLAVDGEFADLI